MKKDLKYQMTSLMRSGERPYHCQTKTSLALAEMDNPEDEG